jgi:hypothetical protein
MPLMFSITVVSFIKMYQSVQWSLIVNLFLFTVDLDLERDLADQFLSSLSITVLSFIKKILIRSL